MNIEVFYPKSTELEKVIECFYFIERNQEDESVSYLTFPSNNFIFSAIINAEILKKQEIYLIKESNRNSFFCSLVGKFNKPFLFQYAGKIFELTIYFKPLGINHFLTKNLDSYKEGVDVYFEFDIDFQNLMLNFKKNSSKSQCADQLESFLISKIKPFNHSFLNMMIENIDTYDEFNLESFSKSISVSQKTIIQESKKHLLKTPLQYKKVHRFRKTLLKIRESESLSDLSYLVSYFDQSHMIKEFKSITGFTPKQFFSNINHSYAENISWIFK